jgi:hypothetical protein
MVCSLAISFDVVVKRGIGARTAGTGEDKGSSGFKQGCCSLPVEFGSLWAKTRCRHFSEIGRAQASGQTIGRTRASIPLHILWRNSEMYTKQTLLGTFLMAVCASQAFADSDYQYRFTTFDHPDAKQVTFTVGINNRGDISGAYVGDDGYLHGYVRFDNDIINIDVPGSMQTFCGGIRDDRLVTGTYFRDVPGMI